MQHNATEFVIRHEDGFTQPLTEEQKQAFIAALAEVYPWPSEHCTITMREEYI